MATCMYCGKGAGFFSKYHEACFLEAEKRRKKNLDSINSGVQSIKDEIAVALKDKKSSSDLRSRFNQIASQHALSSETVGHATLSAVDELSREEPLEPTTAEFLFQLCKDMLGHWDNVPPTSRFYPSYEPIVTNLTLSRNLWVIMQGEGKALRLPNVNGVVLQPDENILAEFGTVLYRKSVMVSSHAGGYNGVGVRVASGLYYRFGGYAGHTLSSPENRVVDNGGLVLTNKGMYLAGQEAAFRVPYNSILRFKAYPDGLGFFRGFGGGREEMFTVINSRHSSPSGAPYDPNNAITYRVGWFLYNLVTFLTTPNQTV